MCSSTSEISSDMVFVSDRQRIAVSDILRGNTQGKGVLHIPNGICETDVSQDCLNGDHSANSFATSGFLDRFFHNFMLLGAPDQTQLSAPPKSVRLWTGLCWDFLFGFLPAISVGCFFGF